MFRPLAILGILSALPDDLAQPPDYDALVSDLAGGMSMALRATWVLSASMRSFDNFGSRPDAALARPDGDLRARFVPHSAKNVRRPFSGGASGRNVDRLWNLGAGRPGGRRSSLRAWPIETNFTSVACWLMAHIARWDHSQPPTLIVIGSVAGNRSRARDFVYGSANGGIDRFLEGLQQPYAGTKLRVVRVKPGLVDIPMTADIAKAAPLWTTPDRVSANIKRAADHGHAVIYTPWFWWPIKMVIRHLPRFVFHHLKI